MFSTHKFHEKKTAIYCTTPTLTGRNPAKLSVGLKNLDDKCSQKSEVMKCRSCDVSDLIQLPASRSPSVTGSANKM